MLFQLQINLFLKLFFHIMLLENVHSRFMKDLAIKNKCIWCTISIIVIILIPVIITYYYLLLLLLLLLLLS